MTTSNPGPLLRPGPPFLTEWQCQLKESPPGTCCSIRRQLDPSSSRPKHFPFWTSLFCQHDCHSFPTHTHPGIFFLPLLFLSQLLIGYQVPEAFPLTALISSCVTNRQPLIYISAASAIPKAPKVWLSQVLQPPHSHTLKATKDLPELTGSPELPSTSPWLYNFPEEPSTF